MAAVVDHQRPRYVDGYRYWAEQAGAGAPLRDRVLRIFEGIATAAANPNWKGCCIVRLTAELGNLRGHPVHRVVAEAQEDMERWFASELTQEGRGDAAIIARQLAVLINGLVMMLLVTRRSLYAQDIRYAINRLLPDTPGGEAVGDRT